MNGTFEEEKFDMFGSPIHNTNKFLKIPNILKEGKGSSI